MWLAGARVQRGGATIYILEDWASTLFYHTPYFNKLACGCKSREHDLNCQGRYVRESEDKTLMVLATEYDTSIEYRSQSKTGQSQFNEWYQIFRTHPDAVLSARLALKESRLCWQCLQGGVTGEMRLHQECYLHLL